MEALFEDGFEELIETAYGKFIGLLHTTNQTHRELDVTTYNGRVGVTGSRNGHAEIQIIYNTQTLHPYEMSVRAVGEEDGYRWIHPAYINLRNQHFGFDIATVPGELEAITGHWYDTESIPDILDKIEKISNNEPHDGKVVVVFDIEEEDLEKLRALADAKGMSFDEYFEHSIREELTRLDKKAFPKKTKKSKKKK